jgi:hypothetical protein
MLTFRLTNADSFLAERKLGGGVEGLEAAVVDRGVEHDIENRPRGSLPPASAELCDLISVHHIGAGRILERLERSWPRRRAPAPWDRRAPQQ